jgi:hypothetical protein
MRNVVGRGAARLSHTQTLSRANRPRFLVPALASPTVTYHTPTTLPLHCYNRRPTPLHRPNPSPPHADCAVTTGLPQS